MNFVSVANSMKLSSFAFVIALPAFGQGTTVFRTGFDYPDGIPTIEIVEDLNEAEGQIGEFSGFVPAGEGGFSDPYLMSVRESTGFIVETYLLADRATEDFAFSANFTEPLELSGAVVSFEIGTSRISSDHSLDSEIVGFSSDGEEVFHLWVSAKSTDDPDAEDELRMGYEGTDTDGIVWNFPPSTGFSFGSNANGDIGFFNGNTADPSVRLPSTYSLFFTPDGFSISFSGGDQGGSNIIDFNIYGTGSLPFNGPGSNLARIEFRGQGGDSNDARGGFWLDNLLASGTPVPEPPAEFEILSIDFDPTSRNGTISFASMPGFDYIISGSNDMQSWTPLDLVQVTVGSVTTAVETDIPEGVLKRFYQVEAVPQQSE